MTPDDIRRLADDRKTGFIDWYSMTTQVLRASADVVAAGKQLLANIEDYQRINNLGGDDNQDQVDMRAALAGVEKLKP